jgi:hypothetical protein
MANRCAGLDPTWAHLPTPAPTHTAHAAAATHYNYCSSSPVWLTSAAAFENEALTSALRASMAPAHPYSASAAAAASSFSSPATPSSSTTSSASEFLSASSGHDAPAPVPESSRPGARALAGGPRGGRVTKRKPRPSRRPQTTYITADPANFRRMVQEITGLPVPVPGPSSSSFPAAASEAAPNWTTPAPACVLPTLDTSAFLLDRAAAVPAAPEEKSPAGGGHASSTATDAAIAVAAAAAGDDDGSSALLELEALVCAAAGECGFPTLESWGMII